MEEGIWGNGGSGSHTEIPGAESKVGWIGLAWSQVGCVGWGGCVVGYGWLELVGVGSGPVGAGVCCRNRFWFGGVWWVVWGPVGSGTCVVVWGRVGGALREGRAVGEQEWRGGVGPRGGRAGAGGRAGGGQGRGRKEGWVGGLVVGRWWVGALAGWCVGGLVVGR